MSRYTGAKCRLCRREGEKLFLRGLRCEGQKCAITRRNYKPGQVAKNTFGKLTEYAKQLRAKQKARRIYGISEKQFAIYSTEAMKKKEETGMALLKSLETRLDNAMYRAGFAVSRNQARQLVSHGAVKLNGRRVDIPSIQLKVGDTFEIREKLQKSPLFEKVRASKKFKASKWLKADNQTLKCEVINVPDKDDVEASVETQLVIEFYSK